MDTIDDIPTFLEEPTGQPSVDQLRQMVIDTICQTVEAQKKAGLNFRVINGSVMRHKIFSEGDQITFFRLADDVVSSIDPSNPILPQVAKLIPRLTFIFEKDGFHGEDFRGTYRFYNGDDETFESQPAIVKITVKKDNKGTITVINQGVGAVDRWYFATDDPLIASYLPKGGTNPEIRALRLNVGAQAQGITQVPKRVPTDTQPIFSGTIGDYDRKDVRSDRPFDNADTAQERQSVTRLAGTRVLATPYETAPDDDAATITAPDPERLRELARKNFAKGGATSFYRRVKKQTPPTDPKK